MHLVLSLMHFFFFEHRHSLGKTCLHYAFQIGSLPIVQYLIEKCVNFEAKNNTQWTPLHYVCVHGYFQVVHFLIEKGANIEASDYK